MRIAIAAVGQETGSFTTHRTSLEDFRQKGLDEGESILEKTAGVGCLGGFLAAAGEEDAEIVPLPIVNAWASAGGTITEDTLDFFRDKIVAGLKQMGANRWLLLLTTWRSDHRCDARFRRRPAPRSPGNHRL